MSFIRYNVGNPSKIGMLIENESANKAGKRAIIRFQFVAVDFQMKSEADGYLPLPLCAMCCVHSAPPAKR